MAKFKSILPDDGNNNKMDETVRMSEEERQEIERAIRERQMDRGRTANSRKARPERQQRPSQGAQRASQTGVGRSGSTTGQRRRPQKKRNKTGQWIFVGVMAVLALLIFTTAANLLEQSRKIDDLEAQLKEQQTDKERLETSIAQLENELNTVNTDEFIERYAHEKLGMVKPNEIIYEVETEGGEESLEESTEGEPVEESTGDEEVTDEAPVEGEESSDEESSSESESIDEEETPVEEDPGE